MKRLLAMLLCLAMVLGMVPAVMATATQEDPRSAEEILKERRDTIYNTMMSMANFMWRATEDFTYYFATSKVTIVKGRLYRGMPYTHARGTLASFQEYASEPNEKGEHDLIGVTPEMFDGGSQHARLGNDCSGAASTAYAAVSATTKNVGSSSMTLSKGYLPIGSYKPDPDSNSNGKQICIDNGQQVMFESYALTQYADLVACSGHTMMTQKVNVVRNPDGTINGDESTMTVVHQNPDPIRNNRYFTSGPYSEANYGEKVYRTFVIDDPKTFTWLFDNGYMPYTCIELIDPSPIPELEITDTETEHSFANLMTGTIKANRLIDSVTMTITDDKGNVVQQGTARCYRTNAVGTNWDMAYDLSQLRLESPQKIKGMLNINLLGAGNYHCRLDIRLMTGDVVEKVRDFDFSVTEDDLGEGWVDNSNLEFTEVDGKKMAVCPVCGGESVEWTILPQISKAQDLAPGHYYLAEDLNNSARYAFANGTTACIHLNGHNITSSSQVFWLGASRTLLNVMGNGNVMGGHTAEDNVYGATINFSAATAKAALYGGNYGHSLGTARPTVLLEASQPELTIYSGATFCRMDDALGANIEIRSGVVNLRGGRILDGTNTTAYGGNVRVYSSAKFTSWPSTFNMYDGIIAGGRAKYGGNVMVCRESSAHGSKDRTFNMYGGLMHFGFAGYAASGDRVGGNIYASGTVAKVNQTGGTITYGKSYSGGGNIYAKGGATIHIGGVVEFGNGDYGSTKQSGGNIYLIGTKATDTTAGVTTKLTVTGTVRNTLTAAENGGNIFCSHSDVIVDGGEISGGTATSRGGNIYITNTQGNLTVKNGGKILNGTAPLGGNVGTNIATAVINVESGGEISGGTTSDKGPDLLLYAAATVNLSDCTIGNIYANTGKVTISGNTAVEKMDFTTGTLKIDNGWSGSADVNWGGSYVTDNVLTKASCGSTTNGTFTAGGSYSGSLIYNGEQGAIGQEGKVVLVSAKAQVVNGETVKWYMTVEEALQALTSGSVLKLYTDATLELQEDIYLDINGNTVSVSGDATVYGIDSSNDDYSGNGVLTTECPVEKVTIDPNTGNQYVAISADGKTTFHRMDVDMQTVTLRPDAAGVYYKAQYNCDETLAALVKAYGVVLSVDNMPGTDFLTEAWDVNRYTVANDPFKPGVIATSGSVFGILKEGNRPAINLRNGEMVIYANAYVALEDGTMLMADQTTNDRVDAEGFDGAARSLLDVLKNIDANWEKYEEHHTTLQNFFQRWSDKGIAAWADVLENIA